MGSIHIRLDGVECVRHSIGDSKLELNPGGCSFTLAPLRAVGELPQGQNSEIKPKPKRRLASKVRSRQDQRIAELTCEIGKRLRR